MRAIIERQTSLLVRDSPRPARVEGLLSRELRLWMVPKRRSPMIAQLTRSRAGAKAPMVEQWLRMNLIVRRLVDIAR